MERLFRKAIFRYGIRGKRLDKVEYQVFENIYVCINISMYVS